jgi:hypothetical protein
MGKSIMGDTMRKLFLAIIIIFIPVVLSAGSLMMIGAGTPAASSQSFSVLQSKTTTGYGSYTTIQPTSSVTAGSLIVIWLSWGASDVAPSISDGTSAFTGTTRACGIGGYCGEFLYLLSSVASGTVTYTAAITGSPTYINMEVWEVSHGTATTLDTNTSAASSGTAANSGNITTANAVEIVFGGLADYGTTGYTSPTIGGTAMTSTLGDSWANGSGYRILSSTMTNGAAAFTVATSQWQTAIIAFK